MKNLLSILLTGVILFSVTGCNNENDLEEEEIPNHHLRIYNDEGSHSAIVGIYLQPIGIIDGTRPEEGDWGIHRNSDVIEAGMNHLITVSNCDKEYDMQVVYDGLNPADYDNMFDSYVNKHFVYNIFLACDDASEYSFLNDPYKRD